MTAKSKNFFITVEGIEGAGKSTVLTFLDRWLSSIDIAHTMTREPGGTVIANAIRQLLLAHYDETMASDAELLLMFASRAQNIARVIKPALAAGEWVICDRFTDASYAYQGGGRGISEQRIAILENWVHADLHPDVVLLLDLPVKTGINRIQNRRTKDRIEHEQQEFFERVRNVYLERAKQFPERYKIIDATRDKNSVKQQIVNALSPLLPPDKLKIAQALGVNDAG